jgi:hypothetical protein
MYQVQQITDYPLQERILVMPDGTTIDMTLEYKPMQLGWFIKELSYGTFEVKGKRVCVSPDLFLQYRGSIPFGLACFTTLQREPTQQEDFLSGAFQLYVLSQEEVIEYLAVLNG